MARTLTTVTTSWASVGTGPLVITVAEVGDGRLFVNSVEDEDSAIDVIRPKGSTPLQFDCRATVEYFVKASETGWKVVVDTD
jgi:hypothetical protein